MPLQQGKDRLQSLHRQWRAQGFLLCVLLSLSVALPLAVLLHRWSFHSWWWSVLLWIVCLGAGLWFVPYWRLTIGDASRWLDRNVPALEESSGLLLHSPDSLGRLEQLQAERVGDRLSGMPAPHPLRKRLLWTVGVLVLAVLLSAWIGQLTMDPPLVGKARTSGHYREEEATLSAIKIRIVPPAYTGKALREQAGWEITAEEGAQMRWELETSSAVDSVGFVFNDSIVAPLQPMDATHCRWQYNSLMRQSGFYQVRWGRHFSDRYKIAMIRDEAPQIVIRAPKPYTVVDYGTPRKIGLSVQVRDDYGVTGAAIVATVASGSGEAVRFKEQVLSFDQSFAGVRPGYDLSRVLDLDALGVRPGDELYCYCRAKDNHGQEARSEMVIISLPDTAQLMSLEGMATGGVVKPEYFRSERQIIIETEQLLREQDTIARKAFERRSNDLGIDQQLLRLRYGKFLGEEAEEGGVGEGFSALPSDPKDFGNAAKVLDAFTDKHDNAEDATYFTTAVKQQLKATLTEMWNAELRLRTFKPKDALPYAYKALRLLKELQQQTRAFVAKTGVRVPPLDINKRLSGNTAEVRSSVQVIIPAAAVQPETAWRMALGVLELRREGGWMLRASGPSTALLQQAAQELGRRAASRPEEWLAGYEAMRRVIVQKDTGMDVWLAEGAIKKMLPAPESRPAIEKKPTDGGLSRLYFHDLQKREGKE